MDLGMETSVFLAYTALQSGRRGVPGFNSDFRRYNGPVFADKSCKLADCRGLRGSGSCCAITLFSTGVASSKIVCCCRNDFENVVFF